ncbi:hypothetical protein DXG03_000062 [Asterophora parasitica]|uniref:Uncharacterized protein n=1 Tax=Asterophora parasitica TaxID=117018 RepID=A0A9P7GK05_9AGAR|nr:hypothetical protein DXG03_000062 [Asterophora parasitica]
MAGHKRPNGLLQCPVSEDPTPAASLASPPPSPRASPSLSSLFGSSLTSLSYDNSPPSSPPPLHNRLHTIAHPGSISPKHSIKREPSFREPIVSASDAQGYRHWRNPNWTDPPVKRLPSPSGSAISTVLIDDDQRTIRGSDYNDNQEDDCASVSSAFMGQVAESLRDPRVVSMFPARPSDQALAQQLAAKRGMHAAQVRVPSGANTKPAKKLGVVGSWWMVVGRDPALVSRVIDQSSAQRAMPGVMGDLVMEGPRLTTLLELIFTGLVAGIVLLCGLAYL